MAVIMIVCCASMIPIALSAIKAQRAKTNALESKGQSTIAILQLSIIIWIGGLLYSIGSIIYHLTR